MLKHITIIMKKKILQNKLYNDLRFNHIKHIYVILVLFSAHHMFLNLFYLLNKLVKLKNNASI